MATDSNMGSHQSSVPFSVHHPHMVSFQSSELNSSTEMIPVDMCSLDVNSSMTSTFLSTGSDMINNMDVMTPAWCPAVTVREPMPRFTHVTGLPAYWSPDELRLLNIGLVKYANKQNISKYAEIASMLPQKTIRDVALRCQWMIDMMVGSSSTANIHIAPNSIPMHQMNIYNRFQSVEMKHLIDENYRCLSAIARNLQRGGTVQENISLFLHMRNNITMIENRIDAMSATTNHFPLSMAQMPPLRVSVNDQLLSCLIPLNGNAVYVAPRSSHLQLDPTCFGPTHMMTG
ncbi:hypothetical protein MUK42_10981 [Musa troglodytarum]|uniref:Myb-like domain-containing protein n=1 Tax=Musa troglodytarum TaxID=320322 RepID=A0A9E7H184_9LILI|nr:hypothetical protein MUK42_10981 [Musa troglodytarum]